MADSPDLAALARRYVDLWQDQLTAMAADPALAESTARLLAALVPAGWPPQPQDDDAGSFSTGRAKPKKPTAAAHSEAGAAAVGVAPDECDRRLAQLTRRVGALEKRLTALEAGISASGRDAEPRPRRRRK